ncbi:MAG: hypothetical protein WDZ91_15855 [Paenibacillaceae bacterium]
MNSNVMIPHGEEKITIELSVKEALALSGVKFAHNHELALDARKKVQQSIENKLKTTLPH